MKQIIGLAAVLLLIVASGCSLLSGKQPDRQSHTGDAQLDLLNQGYSLLYADVSGLPLTDNIFLIKFESDATQALVTDISDYAAQLTAQLETLPRRYPRLRIDLKPLPDAERTKQAAARKDRILSFAPVVGRTGANFERTLLLTLSGGLNQLRFLTQVIAEEERSTERKQAITAAGEQFLSFYKRCLKLLNENYYKHDTYDPEAF